MSTQWRKIAGDFRERRLQIFLIAIILVLGTAGVIAALNARTVLAREIGKSYERANSADLILWFDKAEPEIVELVRSHPEVAAVEERATLFSRIAGKSGDWFPLRLTVLRDFSNQTVNLASRAAGLSRIRRLSSLAASASAPEWLRNKQGSTLPSAIQHSPTDRAS